MRHKENSKEVHFFNASQRRRFASFFGFGPELRRAKALKVRSKKLIKQAENLLADIKAANS